MRVTWALAGVVLAFLAIALAGCLASPERSPGPHPVLSKDGALAVTLERFRARDPEEAEGGPGHIEAVVRARRARGPKKGECVWFAPLDSELTDAMAPAEVDDGTTLRIEGEVVKVVCHGGQERRFALATG
ncbi:MAG TPA: hypothetical protein VHF22_12465, partial [Planctomycetota bacterium]|nr:hypothetical protein [Planctomycetota bacterium]